MENPAFFIIIKMSNNVFPAHCFQAKWFAKWIVHQQQHSFSSQDPYLVFMFLSRKQFTSQLIMNFSDWFAGIHHVSNPPSFCKTTVLPQLVLAMAAVPWLLEQGWLQELSGSFEKTEPLVRGRRETRREMPWRRQAQLRTKTKIYLIVFPLTTLDNVLAELYKKYVCS